MLKVSVVVPTFRSTEHLDELIASLDRQTMPQDEFEVLLVDDGSPDDTYARLERFARDRDNVRAFRLAPSGWPSAPRNHGIAEAAGEYIVFIDHDDRLFPDALRAAYELAARAGADVLDGKESKSNTPGWAMRDITENVDNAITWTERHPLLPMNPHKMFRTAFLREKGVRFPEGGRQIWEDIHFDIAAHARADVVSLLVETPFYYWNRPAQKTTSGTFEDHLGEYLDAVVRVFRWIDEELQQERFDELRSRFIAYQIHMRVLPLFADRPRTEADRVLIREVVTELLERVPESADVHLDPWRRIKIALLRAGRFDLVAEHETTVPRLVAQASADAVGWADGALSADVGIEWTLQTPAEAPAVVRDADRVRLALTPAVAAFAEERGLGADVTDLLAEMTYALDRRSRTQKVDWLLGTHSGAPLSPEGVVPLLSARAPLRWALEDDGPGRLDDGPWDFYLRTVVLGTRVVRQIRTSESAHRWAAVGGVLAATYRTQNGCLSVDVGQTTVSVLDDSDAEPRTLSAAGRVRFEVDLPHVAVLGPVDTAGELVGAGGRVIGTCRITTTTGAAVLEGDVPVGAGRFRVRFGGRNASTVLEVTRRGTVRRGGSPSPSLRRLARSAWVRLPDGVRRRVWRLRHRH